MKRCWLFHDWTRWEIVNSTSDVWCYVNLRKSCRRCGLVKIKQYLR